ncbi:uncharacterized protein LOC108601818 [Drosophila busckii]|uniref:uncharacterized protein LOC108601818 n=1 Tax=Drosophila busckii TaxID=30019 RepID=UPI00083EADED|nr:uncharacterized protein LOC108601818 [Drosophila busckii]
MQLKEDPAIRRQLLYIHELMLEHIGANAMERSMHPMWYRVLSLEQKSASCSLHTALRDDIEHESTHRVMRLLSRLGIDPRPPRQEMRQVIRMSRGSDVAFLWFLMEMFYKSEDHGKFYTFNEQIILSSIFWLDLSPTLLELDRVLPLPNESAMERLKQARALAKQRRQRLSVRTERLQRTQSLADFGGSPYFELPLMPRPRHVQLLASPAARPAQVGKLLGMTSSITMGKRWFGNFNTSLSERVAKPVLYQEINNIIETLATLQLDSEKLESMCASHKEISQIEESLRQQLAYIKRQQLLKLIDVNRKPQAHRRQRILKQLNDMTKIYQRKFHAMAVSVRRKAICTELKHPDFIYLGMFPDGDVPPACLQSSPKRQETLQLRSKLFDESLPQQEASRPRPSSVLKFLQLGGGDAELRLRKAKSRADARAQCLRRIASCKYFQLGNTRGNYNFNYCKLFGDCGMTQQNPEQLRLKQAFIKALDDDVEYLNSVRNLEHSGSAASLVDRAAKRIYREHSELYEKDYAILQAEQAEVEPPERLDFGQQYYEADNLPMMREMLQRGLQRVARDRRYVLPTLPDVHLVPLLNEWICARYGKRYSQAELNRSYRKSQYLMEHLSVLLNRQIVNISADLAGKESSKVKLTGERFKSQFVHSILELGRAFRYAMQPQHWTKHTSTTYYAYMPGHAQDVDFCGTKSSARRRKPLPL